MIVIFVCILERALRDPSFVRILKNNSDLIASLPGKMHHLPLLASFLANPVSALSLSLERLQFSTQCSLLHSLPCCSVAFLQTMRVEVERTEVVEA